MKKTIHILLTMLLAVCFGMAHAQTSWYGYALSSFGGASWVNHFIRFDSQQPESVQPVSESLPQIHSATYVDGYVWFVTSTRSLCRAPFDEETQTIGAYETLVETLDPYRMFIDMAYNPLDGKMYFLCQNSQFNSSLKYVDLASPTLLYEVGDFNERLWTLAINAQGQAYGVAYEGGGLYQVNLGDATTTLIGPTGKEVWYTQSMAFDLNTGALYWAQVSTANDHGFYQVDVQTGAATSLGEIGGSGAQLTGLFMVPETAPEPVAEVVDFETGDFSQFPFNNTFDIPWQIFEDGNGNRCMRSGNREQPSTTSAIEATFNYPEPGYIYFDGKCRGEGTSTLHDRCRFYIDGTLRFEYGAQGSVWHPYLFELAAGSHTFRWEYVKDNNVNPEGDYFAVDNIKFATGSPCVAPTNLVVNPTPSEVSIHWNGYASSYTLRYKNVLESDWTTVNGLSETAYVIHDLPLGVYDLEIRSDCDEDQWTATTFAVEGEPTVITEIQLFGFTAPVWGAHPDVDLEVAPESPYTITTVEWHRYEGVDDQVLGPEDCFNLETVNYYLYVVVTHEDGFVFAERPAVYFDGDGTLFDSGQSTYHDYRIYTIDFQVTDPTGVAEPSDGRLSVWPNPAHTVLHIDGAEGETVTVYDVMGRRVFQQTYENALDVRGLAPGLYAAAVAGRTLEFIVK